MYDLNKFTLGDSVKLGIAIRQLSEGAASMEAVANRIVQYLYQTLNDSQTGTSACDLVRFFKTYAYGELEPLLQTAANTLSPSEALGADIQCLTLLATAGQDIEWNSRHTSQPQAIPLLREVVADHTPIISQLIRPFGLDLNPAIQPEPNLFLDREQTDYNIFHSPAPIGVPFILAPESFVPHDGVRSVLGVSGRLPSGHLFAILFFLKTEVSDHLAEMFSALALNVQMAILPFDEGVIFQPTQAVPPDDASNHAMHNEFLLSQITTLTQLLELSERFALQQSDRLEHIITELRYEVIERQQTEAALRENQMKFAGIVNTADDAIISVDNSQHIQLFNQGAERIFGYSEAEAIGQSLDILLPLSAREIHHRHIEQFGLDGVTSRTMAERSDTSVVGRRKSGEEFPAEASISKLQLSQETLYTVILRDSTERVQVEAALHQRNEGLARTLQQLQTTQQELIQAEKMAVLGQLVAGIAHEINTPLGAIRSSVKYIANFLDQHLEHLPAFFQSLSSEHQQCFLALLARAKQKPLILSSRERRQLRKQVASLLDDQNIDNADTLAELLMEVGVHDQLEPFIPLLREADSDAFLHRVYQFVSLQESTKDINTAADRAAKVVFALRAYARHDQADERIEANIIDGIETVLTLYYYQIKRGVEVTWNYQTLPTISCFFDELNQVWTNLIQNALQAMDYKGALTIDAIHEEGYIKVNITDNGKGIPVEIQDKIFQTFFTTKPPGEGSGLGLDIVKKIVEKHDGSIAFTSVPGKTTFTVSLPVKRDSEL